METMEAVNPTTPAVPMRPRLQLRKVLASVVAAARIPFDQRMLVVGGGAEDEHLLRQTGFQHIVNSNLPTDMDRLLGEGHDPKATEHIALDVEQMDLPTDSYDIVFASDVLHHCASPQKALTEMIRVCRRYVLFLEPNDSAFMSALVSMKFSNPYELPAVIDHNYQSGGLRDSCIPNFIYRWSRHEVVKTVSSCIPEHIFHVHAYPYWDFAVTKKDLDLRKETRIGSITSVIGTGNFIALLKMAQFVLNSLPLLRSQGNKFFCCIEKSPDLKPWMARDGDQIVFNREFGRH